ncbi:MAG: hypothetical protein OXD33_09030 [Rhodobacteraceae bacterium]|nr:hypothetical protein [Paracoccaceae bacterium]
MPKSNYKFSRKFLRKLFGKQIDELNERTIRNEEGMKTMRSDLNATLDNFRADQALLRADIANRDKAHIQWIVGVGGALALLVIGATSLLVTLLTAN